MFLWRFFVKDNEKSNKADEAFYQLSSTIEGRLIEEIKQEEITDEKILLLCENAKNSKAISDTISYYLPETQNDPDKVDQAISELIQNTNTSANNSDETNEIISDLEAKVEMLQRYLCSISKAIENSEDVNPDELTDEKILLLCENAKNSKAISDTISYYLPETQNDPDKVDQAISELIQNTNTSSNNSDETNEIISDHNEKVEELQRYLCYISKAIENNEDIKPKDLTNTRIKSIFENAKNSKSISDIISKYYPETENNPEKVDEQINKNINQIAELKDELNMTIDCYHAAHERVRLLASCIKNVRLEDIDADINEEEVLAIAFYARKSRQIRDIIYCQLPDANDDPRSIEEAIYKLKKSDERLKEMIQNYGEGNQSLE